MTHSLPALPARFPSPRLHSRPSAPEDAPGGLCSVLLPPSLTSSSHGPGAVVPEPCEQALGAQSFPWLQSPHFPVIQLPWLLPNITFDFITRHQ